MTYDNDDKVNKILTITIDISRVHDSVVCLKFLKMGKIGVLLSEKFNLSVVCT